MFERALKNFFKNAVCIFVAMGVFYFSLIVVAYGFIGNALGRFAEMFDGIFRVIGETTAGSETAVREFIDYVAGLIDWNADAADVLKQISDSGWLQTAVTGFLHTLDVSSDAFSAEIDVLIEVFVSAIKTNLIVCALLLFAGLYLADRLTGIAVRKKTARRSFRQFLFVRIFRPVFSTLSVAAVFLLNLFVGGFALLASAGAVIVYEFAALIFAWLIYGYKIVPFADAVNVKNILSQTAASLTILASDIVLFLLVGLLDSFVALLVVIPVTVYSLKIIEVNADSYMREVARLRTEGKDDALRRGKLLLR